MDTERNPSPLWKGIEHLRDAKRLFKEELKDYKDTGGRKYSHFYIQLKSAIHTLRGLIHLFEKVL